MKSTTQAFEILTDEQKLQAYQDWVKNPMTKIMLEMAEEHARGKSVSTPPPIGSPDVMNQAALLYAVQWGRLDILDFLRSMDLMFTPLDGELVRNYGDEEILSEYGYDKEKKEESR
jgi:hypothetical protein